MTSRSTHSLPPGAWHGHFAYAYDPESPHPTSFSLSVAGSVVEGTGADGDGEYALSGTWDRDRGIVRWQKRYAGAGGAVVAYLGRWTGDDELTGRWRVVNSGVYGRFTLRPGDGGMFETTTRHARAFLKHRAAAWQSLCGVDLEALRFDGERAMLTHLLRDPDYVRHMQRALAERDEMEGLSRRRAVDTMRVRLRRPMVPGVFALLDRCVAVLGLKASVDLYVVNDGTTNACVGTASDNRISIELTSGLLNALHEPELLYVLGHELGHAILGHLETPRVDDAEVSGLTCLRSYALQRYEELSADRVGLLCCQDVHTALRAEFVLTTGITNRAVLGEPAAFLEHARRAADALESTHGADAPGFDTHPYGELRALAIDLFHRSKTYAALTGGAAGELDEAEMERQVARLVRLMNPSAIEAGLKGTDALEFMLLGAIAVAEASKGTSNSEAKVIRRLGRDHPEVLERLREMPFEEQQIRMIELAELLCVALPTAERAGLVDDITLVARADGRVSKREREVLDGIAGLLGLGAEGVGDTLDAASAGLD